MARRGMGAGKGKGFKNIIPKADSRTHSNSARGIKQPQRSAVINLMRVPYGRKDTPIELREYQTRAGMPVGTIKEYEDIYNGDVKLNIPLTMKEKKEITKKSGLKDTDGDGVGDVLDCNHLDPKKQDFKESLSKFGSKAKELTIEGYKKGKELTKAGIEKYRQIQEEKKEKALKEVDHPLIKDLTRQKDRVREIQSQLQSEDDENESRKLNAELDKEQEQLRQVQEKVTELKVEDLTEAQLKTLAVRNKDTSLFGGNKFEEELLRRIKKTAELDRKTAEINSKEKIEMEKLEKRLQEERKKAKDSGSLLKDIFG